MRMSRCCWADQQINIEGTLTGIHSLTEINLPSSNTLDFHQCSFFEMYDISSHSHIVSFFEMYLQPCKNGERTFLEICVSKLPSSMHSLV
eukprot:jgi/Botrbrau1/21051/Bobra.0144s0052.1